MGCYPELGAHCLPHDCHLAGSGIHGQLRQQLLGAGGEPWSRRVRTLSRASRPAVLNVARGTVGQESQKRKARSIQMCLEVLSSGRVPGPSSQWSQCHLRCALTDKQESLGRGWQEKPLSELGLEHRVCGGTWQGREEVREAPYTSKRASLPSAFPVP